MDKKKKILLMGCIICLIFALSNQDVLAEVGNSGGFGGGSSGGGYSGGGSFGGGFGGGGFMFFGGGGISFIIFIAFIALRIYLSTRGSSSSSGRSNRSAFNTTNLRSAEEEATRKIKEHDPDFSAERFKSYASEIYITLQEAWESKDWRIVRPFESNTLFNMHNRQLQEYIDAKKTNYLNMQDVRQVDIGGYYVDGNQEVLVIRLNAALLDYTLDDESGKILDGSKTIMQERSYRFEFIRTIGVKTNVEEGSNTTNCPNCGAPTQVTSSGECEYCHSIITTGQYGWVLNKYGAWR